MINEEWRPIPEYEGFYCSNLGRIKRLRPGGDEYILRHKIDKYGYPCVCICANKVEYTKTIHRIVARCFIENINYKLEVNHIDGNKTNNFVNNLEWVSRSENAMHAHRTGLITPYSKKVVHLTTGIVFNSIREAYLSNPKPYQEKYFQRMLRGDRKNKTDYKLI